jgi:GH15 family glucan-1,4-alpha-glucosidase
MGRSTCCSPPRFDSPSIFGRLLGDEACHWSIRATNAGQVTRRYLDRTMVLETTFWTPRGAIAASDALAMGDGNGDMSSAGVRRTL